MNEKSINIYTVIGNSIDILKGVILDLISNKFDPMNPGSKIICSELSDYSFFFQFPDFRTITANCTKKKYCTMTAKSHFSNS